MFRAVYWWDHLPTTNVPHFDLNAILFIITILVIALYFWQMWYQHYHKEAAVGNGQGSFESFCLLQLSNIFLRTLPVPNKAVFCNNPIPMVVFIIIVIIIIIIIINIIIIVMHPANISPKAYLSSLS